VIVTAWYRWTQELFCDAVGFTIGGPCFLEAFSAFLSRLVEGDFHRPPERMPGSAHPVTALRVHFLARQAASAGFEALAERVRREWRTIRDALGVAEEFHGSYEAVLDTTVERIVGDMLIEADPRPYTEQEASGGDWVPQRDTPVRLLNWAWQVHASDPAGYRAWEARQVARLADWHPNA
jgi:hypothetical protein